MNQINKPTIIVGSIFILIGIIWTSLPSIVPFMLVFGSSKFKKISPDHYRITLSQNGEHVVNIRYGVLDNFTEYDKDCLVILPANDQFDDDCIDDRNSALGSFVNNLLPNKTEIIKSFIKADLLKRNTAVFNIGQWVCIDLNRIEETDFNFKIGIISVTHLTPERGIKAYTADILLAFEGIHAMMNNKRLNRVYMPLIGSGHGGLSPEISLLCLLIACMDGIKKEDGHRLKEVNIIIYKDKNGQKKVTESRMKKISKFVLMNHL